jgi:uncharacterized membrane protein
MLVVKLLHVLSATFFFGGGMLIAWHKLRADRTGDPKIVAWAQREIVRPTWSSRSPRASCCP